jgi:hypothetical protein
MMSVLASNSALFQSYAGPLTAEIQALRLKLQLFASRQTDATVRSQCLAVDTRLTEVLEGDDPILRQILANSVEQLEEALRWAALDDRKGCNAFSYRDSPLRSVVGDSGLLSCPEAVSGIEPRFAR